MTDLLIVLADASDPARADATRASLAANTTVPYTLRVEHDWGATVLNRAFRETSADVVVLLESGAVVGPRAIEQLLAALESSPRVGLAGPSTNRFWNEQGGCESADEAESRYATLTRSLAPLYSLGDFCYAVKREVFDAIGGADAEYSLGPCWEMDFNVRAARGGFDGLWVCAAYVWRAPMTERRAREEEARFEASRHRFQDKFCGARLRGEKRDYRVHCRGDACPNFAPPPGSVQVAEAPLISCIMPTHNRREFIAEAVRSFCAQDYQNLELIVVDDGADSIADLLPADDRVRYFRLPQRLSVGAKRNFACERARGPIIVHWDDDDWYPPSRVRVQAAALRERGADICGTSILYFHDRSRNEAFLYRYTGGGSAWVAGTTLMYTRAFWERNRFLDMQVGEDSQFVWANRGARIVDLKDPALCVAGVHAGNVSPKQTRGVFWSPERVERIREMIDAGSPPLPPLVSCVMATYNRRPFIPLALEAFRRQTYANRELLVIDDGPDAVPEFFRDQPAVRYFRVDRRISLGAKRNFGCGEARAGIIALWDDDDWYAATRLERQVAPIVRGEADMTGLVNRFVLQLPQRKCWTTSVPLHRTMFAGDVPGGTLVFRRSIWNSGIRFPDISLAEDAAFLRAALSRRHRLQRVDDPGGLFVYVRHGANTWQFEAGKFISPADWSESAPPAAFGIDSLDAYAAAAAAHAASGRS
jgi:glycosyltransferase involved in cell wall biosynthesis